MKRKLESRLFNLERLRKMSFDELSTLYDISKGAARNLSYAINEDNFPVITDPRINLSQMAKITGLTESTIQTYRSVLTMLGLEEKRYPTAGRSDRYFSDEDFLSLLKENPSTYQELRNKTRKSMSYISQTANRLRKENKVEVVNLSIGSTNPHKFSSRELVGELTRKIIVYLPDEEEHLAQKIGQHLPKNPDWKVKNALTQRLKRVLPRKAFHAVQRTYTKY